jgi:hypothetical protein
MDREHYSFIILEARFHLHFTIMGIVGIDTLICMFLIRVWQTGVFFIILILMDSREFPSTLEEAMELSL